MSSNTIVIIGIIGVIFLSILNIVSSMWINSDIESFVIGDERDIEDHVVAVRNSLIGLTVIGVLMIIASFAMLYVILIRDGKDAHTLTVNGYGNYVGVIVIFCIFALISATTAKDLTGDGSEIAGVSLSNFAIALLVLNGISIAAHLYVIIFIIQKLPKSAPTKDELKFEFNF